MLVIADKHNMLFQHCGKGNGDTRRVPEQQSQRTRLRELLSTKRD
jgi:hypothetical protein